MFVKIHTENQKPNKKLQKRMNKSSSKSDIQKFKYSKQESQGKT